MKKKIVSLLLASAMAVSLLAGCGKTETPAPVEKRLQQKLLQRKHLPKKKLPQRRRLQQRKKLLQQTVQQITAA